MQHLRHFAGHACKEQVICIKVCLHKLMKVSSDCDCLGCNALLLTKGAAAAVVCALTLVACTTHVPTNCNDTRTRMRRPSVPR